MATIDAAQPQQRLLQAVLGGAFDPIHKGHVQSATALLDALPFLQIKLLPCCQPVHKPPLVATTAQRLTMLRIVEQALGLPRLSIDTQEIERSGPSYTIDTVRAIRQRYPQAPYAIIMSSEAWQCFHQWDLWEAIFECVHIIVLGRPGYALLMPHTSSVLRQVVYARRVSDAQMLLESKAGKLFYYPNLGALPISSTDIREGLCRGDKSVLSHVTAEVADYIQAQGNLYKARP